MNSHDFAHEDKVIHHLKARTKKKKKFNRTNNICTWIFLFWFWLAIPFNDDCFLQILATKMPINTEHSIVWRLLTGRYEYFRIQVKNGTTVPAEHQQRNYQANRHFNFVTQNFFIIDKVRFEFLFHRNEIWF